MEAIDAPQQGVPYFARLKPSGLIKAFAVNCPELIVSGGHQSCLDIGRSIRITGIKWWRGIVFHAELDSPGSCLARNFGNNTKPKIDARGDTTRSDYIAVFYDPGLLVCGPDERQ